MGRPPGHRDRSGANPARSRTQFSITQVAGKMVAGATRFHPPTISWVEADSPATRTDKNPPVVSQDWSQAVRCPLNIMALLCGFSDSHHMRDVFGPALDAWPILLKKRRPQQPIG